MWTLPVWSGVFFSVIGGSGMRKLCLKRLYAIMLVFDVYGRYKYGRWTRFQGAW